MRRLLIVSLFMCTAAQAGLAELRISADVDRRTVTLGQELVLSVTVSGGLQSLPEPELPEMPGFKVYRSGSSTSFSFSNGRFYSSKVSRFVLVPTREGKAIIPPVTVRHKGTEYRTDPIEITVTQAAAGPPPAQPPAAGRTSGGRELLVKASLDKRRAYVNEQVTLTLRFYRRVPLVSSSFIPPVTTGFWVEELPGERNYYDVVNGLQYYVTEVSMALFPTRAGVLTVGRAKWKCGVRGTLDPFDILSGHVGVRTVTVLSDSMKLEVVPLPEEGRPRGFSGLVGKFSIEASLDKNETSVEEPVTLTVRVSGRGNINALGEVDIPSLPGFRSYDSGGSVDLSKKDGVVGGSKSFSLVLIPDVPGQYTLPPIEVSYFDPERGGYETASSAELTLSVTPGAVSESQPTRGPAPGGLAARDIRYIKTDVPSFARIGSRLYANRLFLGLQALAPAMVLAAYGVRRAREQAGSDPARARSKRAKREAMRRLAEARRQVRAGAGAEAWKAAADALRGYLADVLNVSPAGLTVDDARARLPSLGADDVVVEKAVAELEACDAAAFAPGAARSADPGAACKRIESIVKELERVRAK